MDSGLMDGERGEQSTLARVRDEVIGALAERVDVETVEEQTHGIVLIRIRLPKGLTEQLRLATEEWVQLQLIGLEGAHTREAIVYVPRYI